MTRNRTEGGQMALPSERAELLAISALEWMAATDGMLDGFLAATGGALSDLRAGAGDPAFLGAVLDYLMQDDAWVLGFAASANVPPEMVMRARAGLPGGDLPHST